MSLSKFLLVFVASAGLLMAQDGRRTLPRAADPSAPSIPAVAPNPPGALKADLSLIKASKDGGLVKLLLDYLPGESLDNTQELSTLFLWDLNPANLIQPQTRIRFFYSELRRTPEGLKEFQSAKPARGPIDLQNTEGEGKPAQSIFDRLSIVFVPRLEVYQVKGEGAPAGNAPARRFFQYVPATLVVSDKVFAPQREATAPGVLPTLQLWRIALERSPARQELETIFKFMKPSIDCQSCLDDDKVNAVLERPEFGKYIEESRQFWSKVRTQWAIKQ